MSTDIDGEPVGSAGPDGSPVIAEASLDDLRSDDVRFLQEAAGYGPLRVRIPSDTMVAVSTGSPPRFPAAERLFLAESIRWVESAAIIHETLAGELDILADQHAALVVREEDADRPLRSAARAAGVPYRIVSRSARTGFPMLDPAPPPPDMPRVVVTGCFDWLHSGHLRFFMDAAALGALYVVVGSDRNVALLKGPAHPLRGEQERCYMVGAVRSVHGCVVSSGSGWMDAEPEIAEIQPSFYIVNEDGDQPEKRAFCRAHGIEYVVLQRVPHAGLPSRSSTEFRGF